MRLGEGVPILAPTSDAPSLCPVTDTCPAHQGFARGGQVKRTADAWPLILPLLSPLSPLIWPPPVKAADTKEKPQLTSGGAPTGPLSLPEIWRWCPESDVCGFQKVKMARSFASVSPPKPDTAGGLGGKVGSGVNGLSPELDCMAGPSPASSPPPTHLQTHECVLSTVPSSSSHWPSCPFSPSHLLSINHGHDLPGPPSDRCPLPSLPRAPWLMDLWASHSLCPHTSPKLAYSRCSESLCWARMNDSFLLESLSSFM